MTYSDLQLDTDFLVDTDSVTYPVINKTRNANFALDEATAIIIGCDGTWQFDDSNYTDLPIGSTHIISGQKDYSFSDEHLNIEAIEVKDTDGKWIQLSPIDLYDTEKWGSISDFMNQTGTPQYYDKVGDSIFLYPTPNFSQDDSLRAHFQRKIEHFTTSDTTKEAGFAKHLHRFISISMAYDWAVAKQHTKQNFLLNEKNRYIEMIKTFYSKRVKDEKPRLQVIYQNNK